MDSGLTLDPDYLSFFAASKNSRPPSSFFKLFNNPRCSEVVERAEHQAAAVKMLSSSPKLAYGQNSFNGGDRVVHGEVDFFSHDKTRFSGSSRDEDILSFKNNKYTDSVTAASDDVNVREEDYGVEHI